MKITAIVFTCVACFLGRTGVCAGDLRGSLLELHSCELYAGGCVVSSEATLGGRYMLRAWSFNGGSFHGTSLAGLNLAVLQSSTENLAAAASDPGRVIVYLPNNASAVQRTALLGWLKSAEARLELGASFQTRVVPIQFSRMGTGYALSAGEFVSVKTASLESCATGACGESLWYSPRAQTSVFTVAVDRSSKVEESLLKLKWDDAGRRCVFLGKFGQEVPAQGLYVSTAELCGPGSRLF